MCSSNTGMTLVGSSGSSNPKLAGCVKLELLKGHSSLKMSVTATTITKVATSTGSTLISYWWQQVSWRVTTVEGSCDIKSGSRPTGPVRKGSFVLSVATPISPVLGGSSRQVVSFRVVDSAKNLVSCMLRLDNGMNDKT